MAGFLSFSAAGIAFLFLGALESLSPSFLSRSLRPLSLLRLRFLSAAAVSSAALIFFASTSSFSSAAVAALFLLYSSAGLLALFPAPLTPYIPLPLSFTDLLLSTAFAQEFLALHFNPESSDGVETRYFTLLSIPVAAAVLCSLLCIAWPNSPSPRIARGISLILNGTWLIQIAFSFFSTAIAHGCELHYRSSSSYAIRCRDHAADHRSQGIATLQFNCHLAFLVVVAVVAYSAVAGEEREREGYRSLSKDFQGMINSGSRFTLDSDDEEERDIANAEEKNRVKQQDVEVTVQETNGNGSH